MRCEPWHGGKDHQESRRLLSCFTTCWLFSHPSRAGATAVADRQQGVALHDRPFASADRFRRSLARGPCHFAPLATSGRTGAGHALPDKKRRPVAGPPWDRIA
jgi:hypothetical protein